MRFGGAAAAAGINPGEGVYESLLHLRLGEFLNVNNTPFVVVAYGNLYKDLNRNDR